MERADSAAADDPLMVVLVPPDFLSVETAIGGATNRDMWEQMLSQHIHSLLMEGEVHLPHGTRVVFASVEADDFVPTMQLLRYRQTFCLIANPQPPPFDDAVTLAQRVGSVISFDQIVISAPSREHESAARKFGMHFILEQSSGDTVTHLITDLFSIMHRQLIRPVYHC